MLPLVPPSWRALLLLGLALPIVLAGAPWADLKRALWCTPWGYTSARQELAFAGFPIPELRVRLDQRVPETTPLSVDETLASDPFLSQRLVEGLYPRRLVANAKLRLALLPPSDLEASGVAPLDLPGYLTSHPTRGHLMLRGPLPDVAQAVRTARPPLRSNHTQSYAWWRFIAQMLAVFGWGALALRVMPNRCPMLSAPHDPSAALAAHGLAGLLLLGIFFSVATWLGRGLPRALPIAGVLPGLGLCAFVLRTRLRSTSLHAYVPVLVITAFITLLAWHVFHTPIIGWDGRSIWFFRAHMLAHEGHFAHTDYANPAAAFSNPDYPLLFPALLAHMGLPGLWNERQASGGIAFGLGLVLLGLWSVLRPVLGRLAAALVLVLFTFANLVLLSRGYPDALLAGFLVIGLFGVLSAEHRLIGLLALACAALCKREGLVLATGIALAVRTLFGAIELRGGESRPPAPRRTRRLRLGCATFVALLPGFMHLAWTRLAALPDPYRGAALPDAPELALRLRALGSAYAALLTSTPIHLLGPAGLLVLMGACIAPRLRRQANASLLLVVSLMAFGFAFAVFLVTPLPFAWHIRTALPRIVTHATWLAAISAACLLAKPHCCGCGRV